MTAQGHHRAPAIISLSRRRVRGCSSKLSFSILTIKKTNISHLWAGRTLITRNRKRRLWWLSQIKKFPTLNRRATKNSFLTLRIYPKNEFKTWKLRVMQIWHKLLIPRAELKWLISHQRSQGVRINTFTIRIHEI